MKHFLPAIVAIILASSAASGQVDCSNIGFEQGNASGWELTYGSVTDANQQTVFQGEQNGTLNNDHYITSLSDGNDPKIPSIPMVAPGSTHSIRIGDVSEGGHFSRIQTDYTVTADNTLFQYKFAVILQNTTGTDNRANHEPYQKPGFNILIFDSNGEELPCSSYDIQLQGEAAVDGFQASGDIQFRNWTTGAIDLRNFIGKTITIVVTAHGCTRRRHFGYAYFDAECLKSEIKPISTCPDDDGYMTLSAPSGFGQYKWNDGQTTQNIKVKASLGDSYHVDMVPLGSLDVSCALGLDYTIEFQQRSAAISRSICEGEAVAVGDTVYRTSGIFVRNISKSNVCDSTVTLTLQVNPVARYTQDVTICQGQTVVVGDTAYGTSGSFIRNIPTPTGCDSIVTTNLTVLELAVSLPASIFITQGDSSLISAEVSPPGDYTFLWQSSDALSCDHCQETWASPAASTTYQVNVRDADQICDVSAGTRVFVRPCGISIPGAFSPNHDQTNEIFYVYGDACVRQVKEMYVYSRWGEVIFQDKDFAPSDPVHGWDGIYHKLPAAPGVYPYKIRIELKNGSFKDYSGVVTLLR